MIFLFIVFAIVDTHLLFGHLFFLLSLFALQSFLFLLFLQFSLLFLSFFLSLFSFGPQLFRFLLCLLRLLRRLKLRSFLLCSFLNAFYLLLSLQFLVKGGAVNMSAPINTKCFLE